MIWCFANSCQQRISRQANSIFDIFARNWFSCPVSRLLVAETLAAPIPADAAICRELLENLRDFLLRPLQILVHLTGVFHALSKASARPREASLRLLLQLHELALLRIEVSRSVRKTPTSARVQFSISSRFWNAAKDASAQFRAEMPVCKGLLGNSRPRRARICGFLPRWIGEQRGKRRRITYVCACVAMALSKPSGSNDWVSCSCMYSLKSTPLAERSDS